MKEFFWSLTIAIAAGIAMNGCSSDSDGSAAADQWFDNAFAEGFALSSPLATSSSSMKKQRSVVGTLSIDSSAPPADKAASLAAVASGSSCQVALPALTGLGQNANCYGPSVNYSNHPDGAPAAGTLPTGDLGLWAATEVATTEACAAAQINTLMESVSTYVDAALALEASAVCVLDGSSTALPSSGASVDFTSDFQTPFTTSNPSATLSSATVEANSSGFYEFVFQGTTDGVKTFDVRVRINKTSSTAFEGRIFGFFTTADMDGFDVSFERSGNNGSARALAGTYQTATSYSDLFDSNDYLDLADSAWSGNMNQAIINVDLTTNVGQFSYAWQAGSGDDKTRVFNAYTQASGSIVSGCGFFGYGDDFETNYSLNTNQIDGFICNWAGPGNDHSMGGTTGIAQKQCFDLNTSNGLFEEDASKRAITYAPNVACDDTDGFTYDWPTHSGDGATNDLITLSSDVEYGSYTAPTAPTLSTGM